MLNVIIVTRRISTGKLNRMKVKGKPRCPFCNRTLSFIYEDVPHGHLNQKCWKCGKTSVVDLQTMDVLVIEGPT